VNGEVLDIGAQRCTEGRGDRIADHSGCLRRGAGLMSELILFVLALVLLILSPATAKPFGTWSSPGRRPGEAVRQEVVP
jgi:hypothetical protein